MQSRLGEASHPKTRAKLATLLQHAQRGVLANPTATPRDLAMFVYATADAGLAAEEAAREKAKAASGAALGGAGGAGEIPYCAVLVLCTRGRMLSGGGWAGRPQPARCLPEERAALKSWSVGRRCR